VADMNREAAFLGSGILNCLRQTKESGDVVKVDERELSAVPDPKLSLNHLSFIPELIASVKKAALEEAEAVKAGLQESADSIKHNSVSKEATTNDSVAVVRMN